VIKSFRNKATEKVWLGHYVKNWSRDIQEVSRRKMRMINNAQDINDLRIPPGNRLETLKGERQGQMSIRINDQWRICFVWDKNDAYDLEITDYH
jgi:proteic killer suppression protein